MRDLGVDELTTPWAFSLIRWAHTEDFYISVSVTKG